MEYDEEEFWDEPLDDAGEHYVDLGDGVEEETFPDEYGEDANYSDEE